MDMREDFKIRTILNHCRDIFRETSTTKTALPIKARYNSVAMTNPRLIGNSRNNPVIINSSVARNGGMIFEYEKEIYRPSQANIHGHYGRALNINKIIKLTIDDYIEETIVTAHPNFYDGLVSMHHLHQVEGLFVVDAAYNKK